eukprot:gene819-1595_t
MSAEELQSLLKSKQQELDILQQSYDDYIESSKELEAELEGALQHAEAQVSDCSKRKAALEEKLAMLQEKHTQLTREHAQLHKDFIKTSEKLALVEQIKVTLEQSNDDYQEKLRIALATEDDLRDKLNRTEEESIFLQSDLDGEPSSVNDEDDSGVIEDLELEIVDLTNRKDIDDSHRQLLEESVAAASRKITALEKDLETLAETLAIKEGELSAVLGQQAERRNDEESQLVKQLTDQLATKSAELEITRLRLADTAADLRAKEQLILGLEKRIEKIEAQREEAERGKAELGLALEDLIQKEAGRRERLALEQERMKVQEESSHIKKIQQHQSQSQSSSSSSSSVPVIVTPCKPISSRISASSSETSLSPSIPFTPLPMDRMEDYEDGNGANGNGNGVGVGNEGNYDSFLFPPVPPLASYNDLETTVDNDMNANIDMGRDMGVEKEVTNQESSVNNGTPSPKGNDNGDGDRNEMMESTGNGGNDGSALESLDSLSNFDQELKTWESERLMLLRRISELTQELHLRRGPPLTPGHKTQSQSQIRSLDMELPQPMFEIPTTTTTTSSELSPLQSTSSPTATTGTMAVTMSVSVAGDNPRIPPPLSSSPSNALGLIDASSTRLSVQRALSSQDMTTMKHELLKQVDRLEKMRSTNANLLQKLQALKGNIQVCCRCRPPNDSELGAGAIPCVEAVDDCELACNDRRYGAWRSFAFDKVWGSEATQSEVFSDVEPLALSVNGYGNDFGVSYRTLNKIFELLILKATQAETLANKLQSAKSARKKIHQVEVEPIVAVAVAMNDDNGIDKDDGKDNDDRLNMNGVGGVEEGDTDGDNVLPFSFTVEIKDLLNPSDNPNNSLDARQTQEGSVYVPGLTQEVVTSLEEVMSVFAKGSLNRATGSTNLNEHSSRSHSLLMVTVTTSTNGGPPSKGKLYLVDLAGSERVDKSGVTGAAMKEAQYINKSLSALGDVMEALDSRSKHVPFRNSKLTYLLQDSLGGNSRTMMIVTVCPTDMSVDETLFTLQFATRVRRINLGAARRNVTAKNLEEALKAAKVELKETKKRKATLEETLAEMKREQKRSQEKISAQMDARVRSIDDVRKGVEFQIQSLQKTNADLTNKLLEEREVRQQQTMDIEALQRSYKRSQELLKVASKEKEELIFLAKQKQRDYDAMKVHVRELEKDKGSGGSGVTAGDKNSGRLSNANSNKTNYNNTSTNTHHVNSYAAGGGAVSSNRNRPPSAKKPNNNNDESDNNINTTTTGAGGATWSKSSGIPQRPKTPTKRLSKSKLLDDDKATIESEFILDDDEGYAAVDGISVGGGGSSVTTSLSTLTTASGSSSTATGNGGGGGGGGGRNRAAEAMLRHQERMKKKLLIEQRRI